MFKTISFSILYSWGLNLLRGNGQKLKEVVDWQARCLFSLKVSNDISYFFQFWSRTSVSVDVCWIDKICNSLSKLNRAVSIQNFKNILTPFRRKEKNNFNARVNYLLYEILSPTTCPSFDLGHKMYLSVLSQEHVNQ